MAAQWKLLLLLLGVLSIPANGSDNFKAYQYDNTVVQFTPNGKLLQVEYATQAAEGSSPVLVAPLTEELIVFICPRRSIQDRLILLEDVLLVPSGILPDAIALLQHVQKGNRLQRQQIGRPLSGHAMARVIAEQCQKHAFGGGIRVYGSSVLLTALSEDRRIVNWQTDPSGALRTLDFTNPQVIGGGSQSSVLQIKLEKVLAKKYDNHEEVLRELIRFARDDMVIADDKSQNRSKRGVEVAFVSSTKGVFKPSNLQLADILGSELGQW